MSHVEYIVEVEDSPINWFDVLWGVFTLVAIAGCAYYFYGKHKQKKKRLTL